MEKQEIVKLLQGKYKKFLDNDDMEGLLFELPRSQRSEVASFLMFDVGLDLMNQITEIPDEMLKGSQQIDTIIIPKSIKNIGKNAFANSSIKQFRIQDGSTITTIPNGCFANCKDLTLVAFPSSVINITGAFTGCDNLTSIITPHRNKRGDKLRCSQGEKEFILSRLKASEGEE